MENKDISANKASENKPLKWKFFLFGIGLIVVLFGVFGVVLSVSSVKNLSDARWVLKVADVLNLPVAKVNNMPVSYVSYMDDVKTLKKFYAELPAGSTTLPTDEEISDQALSRLIVNVMVKKLAGDFNVKIEQKDIDEVLNNLVASYPSKEAAESELKTKYGWDLNMYVEKVVKPLLLEQKVSEAFISGSASDVGKDYESGEQIKASHILFRVDDETKKEEVKKQAEEILTRAKNGEDFAVLAKEFGSDGTKDVGGDLGWFSKGTMVPEFEDAVFALQPGQVGENLVETEFGFHIVKLFEKRQARDFGAFFNDQLIKANIELVAKVHDPFAAYKAAQAEADKNKATVETGINN